MSSPRPLQIPVLTYHSQNISGNTYATNDHIALHADLRTLQARGWHIVPLLWVVEWMLGQREASDLQRAVALTFDDGTDFDYHDLTHPYQGFQRSFYNILRDFQAEFGQTAQPDLQATSFAIASPAARQDLCRLSLAGLDWWHDTWWQAIHTSGLGSIQNHSWDHNLPEVTPTCEEHQQKGTFDVIDTYQECQAEIVQAAAYIQQQKCPWPKLFAYPFGQSSDYAREEYFPCFADHHQTLAAFGTAGEYVTRHSSRWNLSRFVCGSDWRSSAQLSKFLAGALAGSSP